MLANIIRNTKKTGIGGGGGGIVTGGDPYYSAVSLLLPMDGTNGSTTFTDSGPNAITVTATSATISTTQSKYGGASAYFDGSGDYLDIPYGDPLNITTDYTIEFWMRADSVAGYAPIFTITSATTSYFGGIYVVRNGSAITFETRPADGAGSSVVAITGGSISTNTWYHVSASVSGNSARLFINGIQIGSTTTFPTRTFTPTGARIGRFANNFISGLVDFQGYIDDLRITKYARYTSNFTPPTAALPTTASSTVADPYYGYTSLLLHMDGSNASTNFVDSGPNAIAVTAVGNAQVSTTQSKYGGASGYFDGSTAYLTQSSNLTQFGTADFTVEFWIRYSSATGYRQVIGNALTAAGLAFGTNNYSGSVKMYATTSTTGYAGTAVLSADTWYHMAFVRQSGVIKFYLNGILDATHTVATNFTETGGAVGAMPSGANKFNGNIDDLRITKYARYTSAFTPPTQAHPNIYNPYTTLPVSGAALWLDASQQNTIFSDAGTTPVTTSGQSVYQWNDLSGNNRHAVQATSGNRPTWVPPASGQNGLGVASFNGSSSFFDTSMSLSGLSSFSIFLVAKSATSGGWQSALRQQSGYQGYFVMPWTGNGGAVSPRIILDYDGGTTTTNTVTLTNGVFNLISFIRTSGTSNVANVNGSLSSTRSANSASLSESVNLSIGRYPQPVAEYFSGSIAEIVIFNRALSVSETASVESYLKTKWGTP